MNKNGYFKCGNCGHYQYTTEFGECEECGYEDLIEITREEYNKKEGVMLMKRHFKIYYNDGAFAMDIIFTDKDTDFINSYLQNVIDKEFNNNINSLYHININNIFEELSIEEFNKTYNVVATEEMNIEEFTDYIEANNANYMYASFSSKDVIKEYKEYLEDTEDECDLICIEESGLFLAMY